MIYLNFTLSRPDWWNRFESLKTWSGPTPLPNKFWEIQIYKHRNLFRAEFSWTIREDHAGLNLELGLIGYEVSFTIYDHRHWDPITKKWSTYD